MLLNKDTEHLEPMFKVVDSCGFEYGTDKFAPDEYLYVRVNGMIDVQIKMDDEGVAVDLYPVQVSDEPITSTWCMYSEANSKPENLPFVVNNVYGVEYGTEGYLARTKGQEFLFIKVKNLTVQIQYASGIIKRKKDEGIAISIFDASDDGTDTQELAGTMAFLKEFVEV
jgi:hypothetical protein